MTSKRSVLFAALVGVSAITIGCGPPCAQPKAIAREPLRASGKQAVTSEAEVYLTGMVLRDYVNHVDYPVDLAKMSPPNGIAIAPYVPLRFNHDVTLHVRQQVGDKLRDFHILLGPDPQRDPYAEGQVETSGASMGLGLGWAIMAGEIPVGESEWVSGTTDGTQWALRIWNHPDPNQVQHYVYNLEPAGSEQVVHVKHKSSGDTLDLHAGQFIVVALQSEALPKPNRIPPDDPFVRYMFQRADVAGLDLE